MTSLHRPPALKFSAIKRYDQISLPEMGYTAPDAIVKMPVFQDVYFPAKNKLKDIQTSLAFQQKEMQQTTLRQLNALSLQAESIPSLTPILNQLREKAAQNNQCQHQEEARAQIQAARSVIQQSEAQKLIAPELAAALIHNLQTLQADWEFLKLISTHSLLQADGIIRYQPIVQSPQQLLQEQQQKWGLPIADVAIIGGGPAGLSASIKATHYGLKNVLFEAGYAGQSFSDALAQPVHKMRTSASLTSFISARSIQKENDEHPEGLDAFDLNARAEGADAKLSKYRTNAIAARESITRLTGRDFKTSPVSRAEFARFDDENQQTYQTNHEAGFGRGEFWQYIDEVVHQLQQPPNGTLSDNSTLTEQAPIARIQKLGASQLNKPDLILKPYQQLLSQADYERLAPRLKAALRQEQSLYLLQGKNGHIQLARKLIIATGLVGENGQNGRRPKVFEKLMTKNPGNTLGLWGNADFYRHRDAIISGLKAQIANQPWPKQVFTQETQLGQPDMRKMIALLPAGTRCAVIGSGESAAKSVMELLNLNPAIQVDLFVSQALKASPYQIPFYHGKNARQAIYNQKRADEFNEHMVRVFGTPITPNTLEDLEHEAKVTRRVRIINLNKHFDQNTVVLSPTVRNHSPGFQVYRTYNRVITFLFHSVPGLKRLWKPTSEINGVVVSAGGFDRASGKKSPLFEQLLNSRLVTLKPAAWFKKNPFSEVSLSSENRLTSANDHSLYLCGQANAGINTDTTIFGSAYRAYEIVQHIVDSLQGREMLCFNSDARLTQESQLEAMLRVALQKAPQLTLNSLRETLAKVTADNGLNAGTIVYGALQVGANGQVKDSFNTIQPEKKLHNFQQAETLVRQYLSRYISVPSFPSDSITASQQGMFHSAMRQILPNGEQLILFLGSRYKPNSCLAPSDYNQ